MATNNAINANASGIVSYNGTGTFSALANPLTVANGGSGASSFTAYTPITAGTAATNPLQSVASLGSSGQVLKYNGGSSLPTFQTLTLTPNYIINSFSTSSNPTLNSTYFVNYGQSLSTTLNFSTARFYIPVAGTITAAYGNVKCTASASNQNVSIYIRLNNTTDTAITTTSQWNTTSDINFNNTGLSIAVAAGDYISFKIATPAWTVDPTGVTVSIACAYG